MVVKAAILAVGTELTSGEILNTNGAWLGDKLEDLGFLVHSQMVVPDERSTIHQSLTWLCDKVQLIVVTGGLGPTSDDFTREVIAGWAGQPLQFNEIIWQQMNDLYLKRGLQIRPAHRQQCFFPAGAKIIHNHVGTAHGFVLQYKLCKLIVLPGPPNEIQGSWDAEVVPLLQSMSPQKVSDLKIWTCLGATESEVAEVTEEVIKGSDLTVGYRATVPYVKVKLWVPQNDHKAAQFCEKLEAALKPWVVAHDRQDILHFLLSELSHFSTVSIHDEVTKGRLCSRIESLREGGRPWPDSLSVITSTQKTKPNVGEAKLTLWLIPEVETQNFTVGWSFDGRQKSESLRLPFKLQVDSKRGALYLTELTLKWWLQHLPKPL